MTSPKIQITPDKSFSLDKLAKIIEKVEELKKGQNENITSEKDVFRILCRVDALLEVYEDE